MGLIETEETNQFTFERFAAHPFYTDVNRLLVQQALAHLHKLAPEKPFILIDMACGTGAITCLIIQEVARLDRLQHARVIAVDPSAEALKHARMGVDALGLPAHVEFLQGETANLPQFVQQVDGAFFCNAIHLLPDKHAAIQQIAELLAPGGFFACNSAFYEGAYVPETERFYRLWTRRAMAWLRKEHPDVRPSREEKSMAMQWLTPEDYLKIFQECGFTDVEVQQQEVPMSLDAFRDLGHYWLFIDGALPNVPLALGSKALEVAVYQAGEETGLSEVPRNWLQMVASKA